jgi:hypothetical protein
MTTRLPKKEIKHLLMYLGQRRSLWAVMAEGLSVILGEVLAAYTAHLDSQA